MGNLSIFFKHVLMAFAGLVIGFGVSQALEHDRAKPVNLVKQQMAENVSQVDKQLQLLKQQLQAIPTTSDSVAQLERLNQQIHSLEQALAQMQQYSIIMHENLDWLVRYGSIEHANGLPDFISRQGQAVSLCGGSVLFTVLSQQDSAIETQVGDHRTSFHVGSEAIFMAEKGRAKLSYLGQMDNYFKFRVNCNLHLG